MYIRASYIKTPASKSNTDCILVLSKNNVVKSEKKVAKLYCTVTVYKK